MGGEGLAGGSGNPLSQCFGGFAVNKNMRDCEWRKGNRRLDQRSTMYDN